MSDLQSFEKKAESRTRMLLIITMIATLTVLLIAVAYFFARRAIEPLLYSIEIDALLQEKPTMPKEIHFTASGPSLTLEQINAFEKEIGGRLPDDYKQFLLAHNGGFCEPELGLPWTGGIETVAYFDPLLPASEGYGIRGCIRSLNEVNPRKVKGYLPIAGTHSGGYICIAYRGSNAGKVFYTAYKYKIAYIDDLVPIDVTMVPIADSFTELLDYLVEIPNPYCRVEDPERVNGFETTAVRN